MADKVNREKYFREKHGRYPQEYLKRIMSGREAVDTSATSELLGDLAYAFVGDNSETDSYLKAREYIQSMLNQGREAYEKQINKNTFAGPVNANTIKEHDRRNQRLANMAYNLNAFEQVSNSFKMPVFAQQQNPTHAMQFNGFQGPTHGRFISNPQREIQNILGYWGESKTRKGQQKEFDQAIMNEVFGGKMLRGFDGDGTIKFQGGAMWSQLNSASTAGVYSNFNINAQAQIEAFQQLTSFFGKPNSRNNGYVALDIETLGNKDTGWGMHITEIAANKFMWNKELSQHKSVQPYSWLVSPNDQVRDTYQGLINSLRTNPLQWNTLNDDQRRSLWDLMKYSTGNVESNLAISFTPAQFKDLGGTMKEVTHSTFKDTNGKLMEMRNLEDMVIRENLSSFAAHMENGLKNLVSNGATINEVADSYNQMLEKNRSLYFITHNGDTFDLPFIDKFSEQTGVKFASPNRHLDWLKLIQSTFIGGREAQEAFGRDPKVPYEEGPLTNQEFRRTFGWDTDKGHIGSYDVGEKGTGGIVNKTWQTIQGQIEASKQETADASFFRRPAELSFSTEPVRKGDTFFAVRGLNDYTGSGQDFQARIVDGKPELVSSGFNSIVLNAESFYTVNGIRKLEDGKEGPRYALELYDQEKDIYTQIVREGQDARAQIQQFIQQHLDLANEMTTDTIETIGAARAQDIARRRYDSLLGLGQGYAKGFEAADRIFENVRIWQGMVAEADGPLPREVFEANMNFNSLINGKYNKSEADAFWNMLPRLNDEFVPMTTAINQIKANLPISEKLKGHEVKELNIQRSIALGQFVDQLNEKTGGEATVKRPTLPYEKFVLHFNDRAAGGRDATINLMNPRTAQEDVMRYINRGIGEIPASERAQIVTERYQTLMVSLQEGGYLSKGKLDNYLSDLETSGVTPAIHSQKFAIDLASNLDVLRRVEIETIESKNMGGHQAWREVNEQTALDLVNQNIKYAKSIRGSSLESIRNKLTPQAEDFFKRLDAEHTFTGLKPNNLEAVQTMLNTFSRNLRQDIGYALTVNGDGTKAFFNIFSEFDTTSVLHELRNGRTPNNVAQIAIPLIQRDGTMIDGSRQLNANSSMIYRNGELRKVSTVQVLADSIDDGLAQAIMKSVGQGNFEKAEYLGNRQIQDVLSKHSGTKRNIASDNDSMVYKGTVADAYKQGHVDMSSAVAYDLLRTGGLEADAFNDSAFRGEGRTYEDLKTYLDPDSDFTPNAKEAIDKAKRDWSIEHINEIGRELYANSVKSEHYFGTLGTIDATALQPFAEHTSQTRDNLVQQANFYAYTPEMQQEIMRISKETGVYANFERLTKTELGQMVENKVMAPHDKPAMNIKMAYMNDQDILERIQAMKETEEGRQLLISEGILNNDLTFNEVRMATVYEQQIVMNQDLAKSLIMERPKYINIDKDFQYAKAILDAAGDPNFEAIVKRGDIIGYDKFGKAIEFNAADEARFTSIENDRLMFTVKEQAHKMVFDIEKGTFGGGRGFSLEFMKALTGIEGVGAIIGPDVAKHKDYGGILRGQVNKITDYINEADPAERIRVLGLVKGSGLPLELQQTPEARYEMNVRPAEKISGQAVDELMKYIGLSQAQVMGENIYGIDPNTPTVSLIQAAYIADVGDFSKVVGDDRKLPDGSIGGVKYGPRELDILQRRGLNETRALLEEMIQSGALDEDKRQARGLLSSLESLVYEPESLDELKGVHVFSPNDFKSSPEVDRNRATYGKTVVDSDFIESKIGKDGTGFWLDLGADPKMPIALQGVEGRNIERVFLPYVKQQGEGNEIWKERMTRLNESIVERAQALREARNEGTFDGIQSATKDLQNTLNEFHSQLREDLSSSKGFLYENVLKGSLPNSASGGTKIISPFLSMESGEYTTYVSEVDAKKMEVSAKFASDWGVNKNIINGRDTVSVYDILKHGDPNKDFYVPNLRYPSFHDDAIQFGKLRMSADLGEGQQMISSMLASYLKADSDGDYNHLVALGDHKAQEEMRAAYTRQAEHHLWQLQNIDKNMKLNMENAIAELYENEKDHKDYRKAMDDSSSRQSYLLETMGDKGDGSIEARRYQDLVAAFEEHSGKFGKQLVGEASNLGYQFRQIASQYGSSPEAIEAINQFSFGIEQKIISAKHGDTAGVANFYERSGSRDLISALQRGDWDEALRIDEQKLDSLFIGKEAGKGFQMDPAIAELRRIQTEIGKTNFKSQVLRVGLSSGISDKMTSADFVKLIRGEIETPTANAAVQMTTRFFGSEAPVDPKWYLGQVNEIAEASEPIVLNPETQVYVPESHLPPTPSVPETGYREAGLFGRMGSILGDALHSKIGVGLGIAGGLTLGGLALQKATSGETMLQGDAPHENEMMQEAHNGNPRFPSQQTARVEQNGTGLNGLNVSVRGTSGDYISNEDIGNMAGRAIQEAGINANINLRTQDDTSSIDKEWLEQRVIELLNTGYVG